MKEDDVCKYLVHVRGGTIMTVWQTEVQWAAINIIYLLWIIIPPEY